MIPCPWINQMNMKIIFGFPTSIMDLFKGIMFFLNLKMKMFEHWYCQNIKFFHVRKVTKIYWPIDQMMHSFWKHEEMLNKNYKFMKEHCWTWIRLIFFNTIICSLCSYEDLRNYHWRTMKEHWWILIKLILLKEMMQQFWKYEDVWNENWRTIKELC